MLFSQKQFIIIANAPENVRENPFMKRCPQCHTVFESELVFCQNDGTPLVDENFSLPSLSESDFEAETIIRREPIVVDLSAQSQNIAPDENLNHQTSSPTAIESVVVEVPAKNSSGKYVVFLALGLVLGGALVLATLMLAKSFYAGNGANNNLKQITVNVSEQNVKAKTTPLENRNENKNSFEPMANGKHEARTATDDEEFNGRVIALNAYVRASPSRTAAQIDILPMSDRIDIERREDESSPWFYITCEHGTSGWMHGDTIEFTR